MVQKLMIFCLTLSSNYSITALQNTFERNSLAEFWSTQSLPKQWRKAAVIAGWFGQGIPKVSQHLCCCRAAAGRGPTALLPYPQGLALTWHHHVSHSTRHHLCQALADKNPHSLHVWSFPQCFHGATVPAGSGHDPLICSNTCSWVIIFTELDGCVPFVWEEITEYSKSFHFIFFIQDISCATPLSFWGFEKELKCCFRSVHCYLNKERLPALSMSSWIQFSQRLCMEWSPKQVLSLFKYLCRDISFWFWQGNCLRIAR